MADESTDSRPHGRLQDFIQGSRAYAGQPRHSHQPDFRLARVDEPQYAESYYWIVDGEQRIGLLNLAFGEIEILRFFPPSGGKRVDYGMPAVYSWAALRGVRLCIVPQGTWSNRGQTAFLQDRGDRIRLRYTETLAGNRLLSHAFNLRFDPVLGYILDCAFDIRMEASERFEYANLLAGGLSESRDERKRFQKCIWTRRDGTLCFMYQNPLSLIQRAGPEWSDMPDGGFVGWVAERDMNPFVEVVRATPSMCVTCTQWYDHHIFGKPPQQKSDDGCYHITAEYRLLSLPLPVAKEVEDAARTPLPTDPHREKMGFRQGVVNDFEHPIPAGALYNGCVWGKEAECDTGSGHSGSRSLRVRGGSAAEPIAAGTAIFLETGKRYRLSGWVRTRGVSGLGAFLRVHEVFWNWQDIRATHQTRSLAGDTDWTRLELEFEPVANDPLALPGLVVDGTGTAWFDDVELVEIPRLSVV